MALLSILSFISCGEVKNSNSSSQVIPTNQNNLAASLDISTEQQDIVENGSIELKITALSPKTIDLSIRLVAPRAIQLEKNELQLHLEAGSQQVYTVHGKIRNPGFYTVTAYGQIEDGEPISSMVGFNARLATQTRNVTSAPLNKTGRETLNEHLINLPIDSVELHTQQEKANLEKRNDVPLMSRMTNQTFPTIDGKISNPYNSVVTYLPGTGGGKPIPGELDPPKTALQKGSSKSIQKRWWCGNTLKYVDVKISYDGRTFPMKNTRINVFDENPWLQSTVIATGYTDQTGRFWFYEPNCDTGTFWDTSGSDLYFMVDTLDQYNVGLYNVIVLPFTYSIRTATWWEGHQPSYAVNLCGGCSDSENGLWAFTMARLASDFNADALLNGGDHFPLNIAWPSRDPITIGGGQSHAYVGKIELNGADWGNTTVWHEFGHELMYRTTTPNAYSFGVSQGVSYSLISSFAFGSHFGYEQQGYQLAFNEGWADYFAALVGYSNSYSTYIFPSARSCNGVCFMNTTSGTFSVYPVGGENEMRVSSFLFQYTKDILSPNASISLQAAFGRVRNSLWNAGRYNVDIHEAWPWWIRSTLPGDTGALPSAPSVSYTATKNLAINNYMDTSRIP